MLHVSVGKGNMHQTHPWITAPHVVGDGQTHTALEHIFLHGDDEAVLLCHAVQNLRVDGLCEPQIHEGTAMPLCLQFISHMVAGADHASDGQDGDLILLAERLALPVHDGRAELLEAPVGLSPGIADGQGPS